MKNLERAREEQERRMDRYQRVEKPRAKQPMNENELRITAQGLIHNYISYAAFLLQEKRVNEIVLKATGQAISKAVVIAEIIKSRIHGLYQEVSIGSITITDAYEPLEEGLQVLEMSRQVSLIEITLSTVELNKNVPGYQAPKHSSTDRHTDSYGGRGGRGRGRGRGRFGNYEGANGEYNEYGRGGGGRGRGWGFRGMGYGRGRFGGQGRGQVGGRGRGGGGGGEEA